MKILKQNNLVLLLTLFSFSLFIACQKEALVEVDQSEEVNAEILQKIASAKQQTLTIMNSPDALQARRPVTGNFTCYGASLTVDADCDYSFELGWNQEACTWSQCWDKVLDMVITAENNGWCYDVPSPNCYTYNCDNPCYAQEEIDLDHEDIDP